MRFLLCLFGLVLAAGTSFAQCDSGAPLQFRQIPSQRIVRLAQVAPGVYEYVEVRQAPPAIRFVPTVAVPTRRITTIRGPLGRVRQVVIEE